MSGISSVSKSMVGTALKRPSVSLTAADRICLIACSFSNLISVLVGWMLTSMLAGSTSKIDEVRYLLAGRNQLVVCFHYRFVEVGMAHITAVDKEVLV